MLHLLRRGGLNLLGQALEHTRETIRQNTTGDTQLDILAARDYDNDDKVFEVDPITHVRLDRFPPNAPTLVAQLSAFTDSMADNHAPEVHAPHVTTPLLPEQGLVLVSGVVAMDDATFTTLLPLSSRASATSRFNYRALLDTGSPQSFIRQGAFDQMQPAPLTHPTSEPPRQICGAGSALK